MSKVWQSSLGDLAVTTLLSLLASLWAISSFPPVSASALMARITRPLSSTRQGERSAWVARRSRSPRFSSLTGAPRAGVQKDVLGLVDLFI